MDLEQEAGHERGASSQQQEPQESAKDLVLIGSECQESGIASAEGFAASLPRSILFWLLSVLTLGAMPLIATWYPGRALKWRCKACPLASADYVLARGFDGLEFVVPVREVQSHSASSYASEEQIAGVAGHRFLKDGRYRLLAFRYVEYVLDRDSGKFIRPEFDLAHPYGYIHEKLSPGISQAVHVDRAVLFGRNVIDVPVKSWTTLLVQEVLHPFYIFQVYSIVLWCIEDYTVYAGCIFAMSAFSALATLIETRRNLVNLRQMALHECPVTVLRDGSWTGTSSADLVPGDVIEITDNFTLPCDLVLLAGSAIVNESMLTGESVPVLKAALPPAHQADAAEFSFESDRKHVLYSGTRVIQTRFYGHSRVTALAVRTGFHTAKGAMIRSILFPKQAPFKFYEDSFKFIAVMAALALAGFAYSAYLLAKYDVSVTGIALRGLDLTTIIIPPALPAAMTIGTAFAIARLKAASIFCISPPRVNVAGKLKVMCFDKTGTLTEEGLDVMGAVAEFGPLVEDVSTVEGPLLRCLAACHAITEVAGELIGDPLDLIMFQATRWVLEEPQVGARYDSIVPTVVRPPAGRPDEAAAILADPEASHLALAEEIGILRRFDFSSKLQRMSVLVRNLARPGTLQAFVKGSPEAVRALSRPDSVPPDFDEVLAAYTREGLRVLACGVRELEGVSWLHAQRMPRERIEADLRFCGLLIMQNKLKADTAGVLRRLQGAGVRSVMVTGDHVLTAVSVARKCGLVPAPRPVFIAQAHEADEKEVQWHAVDAYAPAARRRDPEHEEAAEAERVPLGAGGEAGAPFLLRPDAYEVAVTGAAFSRLRAHRPHLYDRLLVRGAVFARMSPDEKRLLVEDLAALGYVVGMCGDGANDCGALKAASVGVSLSEAEASIAAPFTSKVPSIACVAKLVREGRAALVTSFQCFKYMALYSMIQFLCVIRLYDINSNLGDWQYLFVDLFLIVPLAVLMSRTTAHSELVGYRPPGSLISAPILASFFSQIAAQAGFIALANAMLEKEPWFVPVRPDPDSDNVECLENTVTFLVGNFQYVIAAFAFSKGKPFRKPIYTNWPYLGTLIAMWAGLSWMVLSPSHWVAKTLQLVPMPAEFRQRLLLVAGANLLASLLIEEVCGRLGPLAKWFRRAVLRARRRPYRQLLLAMEAEAAAHGRRRPAAGEKEPLLAGGGAKTYGP
eukprot:tig00000857_g4950.t1